MQLVRLTENSETIHTYNFSLFVNSYILFSQPLNDKFQFRPDSRKASLAYRVCQFWTLFGWKCFGWILFGYDSLKPCFSIYSLQEIKLLHVGAFLTRNQLKPQQPEQRKCELRKASRVTSPPRVKSPFLCLLYIYIYIFLIYGH